LAATKDKIKQLVADLKNKEKELKDAEKAFNEFPDPTLARGIGHKTNLVNLFETTDIEIIDDVTVWDGQDVYDEIEQNVLGEDE
jgi:hypothetical protein